MLFGVILLRTLACVLQGIWKQSFYLTVLISYQHVLRLTVNKSLRISALFCYFRLIMKSVMNYTAEI